MHARYFQGRKKNFNLIQLHLVLHSNDKIVPEDILSKDNKFKRIETSRGANNRVLI